MEKTENQRIRKAVLEVIQTQVRENDPPEMNQALKRLREQAFSEEEVVRLVGYVVVSEVFNVLKENRPYDREKYIAALNNLPRLPWEKEG